MIACQHHGFQPEFTNHILSLNMHMHLLITIEAVKEKTIWPRNILYCRHLYNYLDYRRITWYLSIFDLYDHRWNSLAERSGVQWSDSLYISNYYLV